MSRKQSRNNISIKTVVRLFFIINIALVIINYVLTDFANDAAQQDRKYVEVSQENEGILEKMSFIVKAIVLGKDTQLKEELKNKIIAYQLNLNALQTGNNATATVGGEIIMLESSPQRGTGELGQLQRLWKGLEDRMRFIIDNQIEIDTNLVLMEDLSEQEAYLPPPLPSDSLISLNDSTVQDSSLQITTFEEVIPEEETISFVTILNPEVEKNYYLAQTALENVLNKNKELSRIYEDGFINSQVNLRWVLFVTFLLNLLVLIVGTFVVGGYFINPLKNISQTAKEVSSGDVSTQVTHKRQDEIGEVADSLNLIVDSFKQYTEFAENIGHGNFDSNFEVKGEKDILGYTLLEMRDSLKNVAEEDKKRNWTNEGFALFGGILRSTEKSIEDLGYDIISNLVKYIEANQGAIFLIEQVENQESYLELKAAFAYNKRKYEEQQLSIGQGLLGQAVQEKDLIYVDKVPKDYVNIVSGLGHTTPRSLLIVPLVMNDEVYGAIEIASLNYLEPYEMEFVQRLSENIASTIANVRISANTKRLLGETQEYAERMQAQEEEMRQNMEELAATQEEMERNQSRLEDYKAELEGDVATRSKELEEKEIQLSNTLSQLQGIIDSSRAGIVALDNDYKVFAANQRMREIVTLLGRYDFNIGNDWFSTFADEAEAILERELWDRALEGEYHINEKSFYNEHQQKQWLEVSFSPIQAKGQVIGASMFVRDISGRKRTQKNTELTAHILDNSSNEVYVFEAKTFKFTQANEKARQNLGYTLEELMQKTPYELTPHFDKEAFEKKLAPLRDHQEENLIIDTAFQRKEGNNYDIELNLQYFEDEDLPLFAAIAQDITERKQYESRLEDALVRFDLATKATKEGVWEMHIRPEDPINPDNNAWWSDQYIALLGFEPEEFEGKLNSWSSRLHPDDRERVLRTFYDHLTDKSGTTPFNTEYRLLHKDGEYRWFSGIAETRRDSEGNPTRIAGSIRNIDRRKKAERELLAQTAIVEAILHAAVNSIISIDANGIIRTVNRATERMFGYSQEELIGKTVGILMPEPDAGQHDQYVKDYIVRGSSKVIDRTREIVAMRKDGRTFPVDISVTEAKIGDEPIFVGILRDISQRKRRELVLAESEERLRKISEATIEGIIFHENGTITDINEGFTRITGYSASEIIGSQTYQYLTTESQQIAREKAQIDEESHYEIELIRKDGVVIPLEVIAHNITDSKGGTIRIASIRDISKRKNAEQARKRLVEILDNLPEPVLYTSPDGIIKYTNQAFIKLLDLNNDKQVLEHSILDYLSEKSQQEYQKNWTKTSSQKGTWQGKVDLKKSDGTELKITLSLLSHKDSEGKINYFTFLLNQ